MSTETEWNSYPLDVADALGRWDRGESVFTLEMGGLGPGYEQCIQLAVIELCRRLQLVVWPESAEERQKICDAAMHEVDRKFDLGMTGAQAGVAEWLAFRYCTRGWRATLEEAKKRGQGDRLIQVSAEWPGKPRQDARP